MVLRSSILAGAAVAAALAVAAPAPARADLIAVAALPGPVLGPLTFATPGLQPAGPVRVDAGGGRTVTFSDPGATFFVDVAGGQSSFPAGTQVIYNGGAAAAFGSGGIGTGTVRIAFSSPVFGFTLAVEDFDTFAAPTAYILTAFDALGGTIGTQGVQGYFGDVLARFTDLSTMPVAALAVSDNDPETGGIGIQLAIQPAQAVPEPSTLALLAAGLVGLAGLLRHRPA